MPEIYSPHYGYFITHFPGDLLFIASLILGGLTAWEAIAEIQRRSERSPRSLSFRQILPTL